jgi:hypothetical protein
MQKYILEENISLTANFRGVQDLIDVVEKRNVVLVQIVINNHWVHVYILHDLLRIKCKSVSAVTRQMERKVFVVF